VRENETLRRIRAALLIPIASNGHLHGVISIGPRLGDLPYSKEDEQLLLVVAAQMSTIIENAKLIRRMVEEEGIRREIDMAAEVQRRLFPSDGLENPAVEIYGTCVPARGVGGDYYDYFEVGDSRIGIAVADVAGKGIAAALVMSTVQALLRSQVLSEDRCLTDVVSSMNSLLRRSTGESGYVTFFFAEIDDETGLLTYVNAGHNPPLLVSARAIRRERVRFQGHLSLQSDGNAAGSATVIALATADRELPISELTTGGPIIGTFLDVPYKQETVQTESGDVLVAYTDGVTEALSPEGVEFGEGRLQSAIIQSMQLTARELTENIIAELCEWQGDAPQHDDITLVVMKVK
jgi:sigma-B regulation protein RsbU (phosphoserine phosphatase)